MSLPTDRPIAEGALVGVVGCGLMGAGIAEVAARSGYRVLVREVDEEALARGRTRIEASLGAAVARGKLTAAERHQTVARLAYTTALAELAPCALVLEAAPESAELKRALFAELDRVCRPDAVLASNTSSLSLVALASATGHPERVLGLHFFNPAPVMRLVEIVCPLSVSDTTLAAGRAFVESLGKRPILVQDRAGFVVNALLIPLLLDGIRLVEQGVASKEDVDAAMKLGCGHPMGPLELADFIGLDTTLSIAEVLYDELCEARYAAPPLLRQMVRAGLLGRKSGRGFYAYGPWV